MKKLFFSMLIIPMMFLLSTLTVQAAESYGSLAPADADFYLFASNSSRWCKYYFTDYIRVCLVRLDNGGYNLCFETFEGVFSTFVTGSSDLSKINSYFGSSNFFIDSSDYGYNLSFYQNDLTSFETNLPIFSSKDAASNYILTGDDTGNLNTPPAPEFDPFSADYDDDVPVPQVITKFNVVAGVTTPIICFTNGSTDYNVVVYGRWNSINDITLRQEKLRWVYDYSSLVHGDLECWVSDDDNRTSRENFDFFSDSHFTDTYLAFLLKYPLAERNITNDPTLFEKLTGYNEALHNFTDLYMNLPNNAYSKPDFFFRYYYRDDEQNIHYSRWAHLTFPLIPPGENGFKTTTDQLWKGNLDYQVANKPLTSEEVLDVDTYFDSDQTKYNIMNNQQSYDLDEIDWTMSLSNLQSITSVFGQMPAFVATVFSCYPAWMVQLIGATITILCALAIYHGIRG